MKIVFIGPQGSGKGTQAKRIAARFGFCHISTGDLLRDAEGELKAEIDVFLNKGELVSDELVARVLKGRLSKGVCEKGFILDGFPRTVSQVEMLRDITDIDRVVEIVIGDDESVRRLSGRRICEKCGAIFNINTSPIPKVEGVCDKCGGELFQRNDDKEEIIRKRLRVYHEETEKVLKMYSFVRIDGTKGIEEVEESIVEALGLELS